MADEKTFEETILERVEKEIPKYPILRKLFRLLEESRKKVKTIPAKKEYIKYIDGEIEKAKYLREKSLKEGRELYERFKRTRNFDQFRMARRYWGLAGYYSAEIKYCWLPLKSYWVKELAKEEGIEFISLDADTGYSIYYNYRDGYYYEIDEEGRIRRKSKEIEITETVSVETEEGHEVPLICEITGRTKAKGLTKKAFEAIQKKIQTQLGTFFKNFSTFSNIKSEPIKIGVEVRISPISKKSYPESEVIIERYSPQRELRYPHELFNAYDINLEETKFYETEPKKIRVEKPLESVRKEEEIPEKIEEKRRKIKEVL
jgi:hypothetical protein